MAFRSISLTAEIFPVVMYGVIEWTKYSFNGDLTKVPRSYYLALRSFDAAQLEQLLQRISADRWAQFRDTNRIFLWVSGIACGCLVLAAAVPAFGLIAFFGWVCAASLGLSAVSHGLALRRERRFLHNAYERARRSLTFDEFVGAPPLPTAERSEVEADLLPLWLTKEDGAFGHLSGSPEALADC